MTNLCRCSAPAQPMMKLESNWMTNSRPTRRAEERAKERRQCNGNRAIKSKPKVKIIQNGNFFHFFSALDSCIRFRLRRRFCSIQSVCFIFAVGIVGAAFSLVRPLPRLRIALALTQFSRNYHVHLLIFITFRRAVVSFDSCSYFCPFPSSTSFADALRARPIEKQ